ncbi:hypothetical protein J6590_049410 [Homalodisca vitripennis]|nr:hypothetical protein J6590_049410 [Homalodisca vitripennis]
MTKVSAWLASYNGAHASKEAGDLHAACLNMHGIFRPISCPKQPVSSSLDDSITYLCYLNVSTVVPAIRNVRTLGYYSCSSRFFGFQTPLGVLELRNLEAEEEKEKLNLKQEDIRDPLEYVFEDTQVIPQECYVRGMCQGFREPNLLSDVEEAVTEERRELEVN